MGRGLRIQQPGGGLNFGGPLGGGGGGGMGGGRGRGHSNNNRYAAAEHIAPLPRSPLRKPRDNFRERGGGGGERQRQGGGGGDNRGQNYAKHNKNANKAHAQKPQQQKASPNAKAAAKTNYRRDLEKYYMQKNLGEVQYKVRLFIG